jgi:outer membrane protein assembly factor BamB
MKQLVLLLLLINPSLGLAVTPSEIVPSGGGLIVYKEEAYYNNKLAGAMLFSKMIPRSPTTTQYFGAGGAVLVPSDGIIASYGADEINMAELSGSQIDQYRAIVDRLVELENINPRVAGVIAPVVEKMKYNIGMSMARNAGTSVAGKNDATPNSTTSQRALKQAHIKSLTTTDGNTYQNATYKSSDDQKVAFSHSDGAARVLWEKLKKEDQLAWGYDAEKLKEEKLAKEKEAEEKRKADELAQQKIQQEQAKAVLWEKEEDLNIFLSNEILLVNGVLYLDGKSGITARDANTGEMKWQFKSKGATSPQLYKNSIIFGSDDGIIYCLDITTGKEKWNYKTNDNSLHKPFVFKDSAILQGKSNLEAVNAMDGSVQWNTRIIGYYSFNNRSFSSGGIYMCLDEDLFWVNASTGDTIRNQKNIVNILHLSPIVENGCIFISSFSADKSEVKIFDENSLKELSKINLENESVVEVEGDILYISGNESFRAINYKTGTTLWELKEKDSLTLNARISNGLIYFCSLNGTVHVLDKLSGRENWQFKIEQLGTPPGELEVDAKGNVYLRTMGTLEQGCRKKIRKIGSVIDRPNILNKVDQKNDIGVISRDTNEATKANSLDKNTIKSFFRASGKGDIFSMKNLLKSNSALATYKSYGLTPLDMAAPAGHLNAVKLLIAYGADINSRTDNGTTPLMMTIIKKQKEVAGYLIGIGADIKMTDNKGYTPLVIAAVLNQYDVVKLLIAYGANVNDKIGDDSLLTIVKEGHLTDIAKLLIENGANE